MISSAVLPVFAVLVAGPTGPEGDCPSARQVTEAMQARLGPAMVIAATDPQAQSRPDVLRTSLDVAGDGTAVRFALVDARGETQLRRTLPSPGRGQPQSDCAALADILAAIVERYLGMLTYESSEPAVSPAASPAGAPDLTAGAAEPGAKTEAPERNGGPRRGLALLGFGWRMPTMGGGQSSEGAIEGHVGAQFDITRATPRLAAILTVGVTPSTGFNLSSDRNRHATLRRFPARLGLTLQLPAGPGWVEPALMGGVDLLTISSPPTGTAPAYDQVRLPPILEVSVGYRLTVAGRFQLRPAANIGVAIKQYSIGLQAAPTQVDALTPRAYASFGIDTVVVFR